MKIDINIFNVMFFILLAICIFFLYKSETSNARLIKQIELKDSLYKITSKKDLVFAKKTEEYAKVITKYVSDCSFTIGNKSITTPELLKISNKAIYEAAVFKDSLRITKSIVNQYVKMIDVYKNQITKMEKENASISDSTLVYKKLYNLVSRQYGIKSSFRREGNRYYFQVDGAPKVDSALRLFPYYKHNMSQDTAGNWLMIMDTERNIKRQTKKNAKNP